MEISAMGDGQDNTSLGTYVLRDLIKDIQLSTDDDTKDAYITCVDAWNGNLYIGTSTGKVLHYVSIPPDPSDPTGEASYIFASELEPPFTTRQEGRDAGVKQILLLPDAGKACILCNATATFYTLPELSPAYGGRIQQAGCTWVGGLDLDRNPENLDGADDPVIVICLRSRLRLVKIGREARTVPNRTIELGDVSAIQRRADLACVADGSMYSLLDVANHRKNDLFPISSLTVAPVERPLPRPPTSGGHSRSVSAVSPTRPGPSHERNFSLGAEPRSSSGWPTRSSSQQGTSPAQPSSRAESPSQPNGISQAAPQEAPGDQAQTHILPPHILSPSPAEFLLTTGTRMHEPGVGMVVNLEGDPSGGTIEFSSYPESLVLDATAQSTTPATPGASNSEAFVVAIVRRQFSGGVHKTLEIQPWNADPASPQAQKEWLKIGLDQGLEQDLERTHCGLCTTTDTTELTIPEISKSLRLRRLQMKQEAFEADHKRDQEEDQIAARFAKLNGNILLFTNTGLSWVTKNPLVVRVERQLESAIHRSTSTAVAIDVPAIRNVINGIRGQDAHDELEFLTLTYIRQRASLLLFGNLLLQTAEGTISYERDTRFADEALAEGDIDPRIVLSLVPPFTNDVRESDQGIWISQGLRDTVLLLRDSFNAESLVQDPSGAYGENLLSILRRYLQTWRKKKGFGSVADEAFVFQSVDAALLYILLLLDQINPRGPAVPGTARSELNEVVDRGVDCFERAVELFETSNRLYTLSRLYQSRKMVAKVLSTWRRIMEGEEDTSGELVNAEQVVRKYLANIRDQSLVKEYGAWLANRNPKLGVEVFADDKSRVTFKPSEAVSILKEKAPGAVKDYLEHLVFDKNHVQYVNDLIAFYLDSVLAALEDSQDVQNILLQSYETYRALKPPKPTYRQFITDNSTDAEWWRNRLRLLQLIGGSHGAASKYDVHALRERLAPYSNELVPEMIILNGREGNHEEALRLLTHGLGDYDTAIRYCLLGGSSIFHPSSGYAPEQTIPSKEEQAVLFRYLLHEFFRIDNLNERLMRTGELLERFGGWFDISQVLDLIPENWSVELVSKFLVHALRKLVQERNETTVVKALASAQNLKRNVDFIEKTEAIGPTIVSDGTVVDAG